MNNEAKSLITFHSAICIGVLLIILLLHFFVSPIQLSDFDSKIEGMAMVALCIGSLNLILANFLFKRKTQAIGTAQINSENIREFRSAYILRWALLEGAILINVIIYFFIDKHPALIVVALLLLLLLYVSKPKLH